MSTKEFSRLNSSTAFNILVVCFIVAAGKVILTDLPKESQMPATGLVAATVGYAAQVRKTKEIRSEREQLAWEFMYLDGRAIVFPLSWETNDIGFANYQQSSYLENLGSTTKRMKSASPPTIIPSSFLNWNLPKLFPVQQVRQDISLVHRIEEQQNQSPIFLEMADFLAKDSTQKQLQSLAKEACNRAMERAGQDKLEHLNLIDRETRFKFYSDVYLYLRVWLKNSIEFDMEMPDIGHSIPDSSLYINAFKFLRDERIEYLFISESEAISPDKKVIEAIRHYLDSLIANLRKGRPASWLNQALNYLTQKVM